MKKICLSILFFLLFAFPIKVQSFATPFEDQEHIRDFSAKTIINKDGTVNIEEKIIYDFGPYERHGIFRNIPTVKTNLDKKKYGLDFSVISVTDENNKPHQYSASNKGEDLEIKIGDPGKTVTGSQTYVISYTVKGALTYFNDHDELYWNVTGNEWQVPISQAGVTVELPPDVDESKVKVVCYTGLRGNLGSDCAYDILGMKSLINIKKYLNPAEGLTIAVSFPKNLVAVLEPKPVVSFWDTIWGKLTILGIILLALFWYVVYPVKIIIDWWKRGRDPLGQSGPVRAWFDPPKTKSGRFMTPAEVGALVDETVNVRDISATIVDLARRGYLKIEERKKDDFYLVRAVNETGSGKDGLLEYEKQLYDGIFSSKDEVRIKDKNLYPTVKKVNGQLYESVVKEGWFEKNPHSVRSFYYAIAGLALFSANILLALIAFVFGRNMPRKTVSGADAANVARSLRNFLTSQERQLAFQANRQMFFEKLLPFAVAFGVEKIWAKRFQEISLEPPEWYSGYRGGRFNSVIFVNSLHSSFNSVAAAAAPPQSSSGFSSGFSGGSSGGGGGGGGGGSW